MSSISITNLLFLHSPPLTSASILHGFLEVYSQCMDHFGFIDIYFQLLRMSGASVGYMLKSPFVDLKRMAKYLDLIKKELDSTESVESSFAVSFHGNLPVYNIFPFLILKSKGASCVRE